MTVKYGSRWIGKRVTDCSGLLRWALRQLGEDIVHHARYQYTECCAHKGRLVNGRREDGQPILPGTAVFLQGKEPHIHHVGVYVGHGVCIEAKGTLYGVVTSELSHWDHWGELNMIDYTDAARIEDEAAPEIPDTDVLYRAEATNPSTWLNVRSGPGTAYARLGRIQRGTVVEVLAEDGGWSRIRAGDVTGWVSAEYLTRLEDQDADESETTPDVDPDDAEPDIPTDPDTVPIDREKLAEFYDSLMSMTDYIGRILNR